VCDAVAINSVQFSGLYDSQCAVANDNIVVAR